MPGACVMGFPTAVPPPRFTGWTPPRGSAHDESREPLGRLVVLLDALDARGRRAPAAEGEDTRDGVGRALEDGLDGPVRAVAHPAGDAGGARLGLGRAPEPDALHPTHDDDAAPHHDRLAYTADPREPRRKASSMRTDGAPGEALGEKLRGEARGLLPSVISLRRALHEHPQLGLVLPRTQQAVLEALQGLDLEISTGGATSAVVATLRGPAARSRPCCCAPTWTRSRCRRTPTSPSAPSRTARCMPAATMPTSRCWRAPRVCSPAAAPRCAARCKFLFQPGEEGYAGARVLIGEGLLDAEPKVDAAFALHVDSSLPTGTVATRPGPLLAAGDVFSIEVRGKGGHAAQPHLARDPIPVACEIVTALQTRGHARSSTPSTRRSSR